MTTTDIYNNDPTSSTRKGGALPAIPKFTSFEDERKYIKRILVVACRVFANNGYTDGIGGYIVVRDPEFTDTYWVNPMGLDFSRVTVSSLVRVNSNGDVIEGNYPASRPAWATFTVVRKMRPEIIAAAHVHSHYGSAWSTFGLPIDYATEDTCIFHNNLSVYTQFNGAIVTQSEGYNMAKCLGKNKAVILQNHGIYTVGETLEEAAWLFISLENACKTQFLLEGMKANGVQPKAMSQAALDFTAKIMGSPYSAWVQFYPIVEKTLAENPDIDL
jgi:ribulose-5-phosphate 4-epimerase/fuculose-1-phosphate aldolase